jgi:thiamine transport system ATP-binding protein
MLELKDVSVSYDRTPAVRDASLELPDGQVLAVLGPSGCGKSTLLRAVAGLEPLVAGTISWDGSDLERVPTHKRGFALMFQDGQLFNHLTVARNIGYALRLRRSSGIAARVEELLALVGLEGYADRLPATLSGGERQRVALARCLAVRPRQQLLDEPLSAHDAALRPRHATDHRADGHPRPRGGVHGRRPAGRDAGRRDRPAGCDRRRLAGPGRPPDRPVPRLRQGPGR